MKNKNLTFDKVYKMPLHLVEFENGHIGLYVWTDNDVMAITFNNKTDSNTDIYLSQQQRKDIISKINGNNKVLDIDTTKLINKGADIFIKDKHLFTVRGWGHLIGIGGLNLSQDKAIKIQDDFIDFIIKRLKQ